MKSMNEKIEWTCLMLKRVISAIYLENERVLTGTLPKFANLGRAR